MEGKIIKYGLQASLQSLTSGSVQSIPGYERYGVFLEQTRPRGVKGTV